MRKKYILLIIVFIALADISAYYLISIEGIFVRDSKETKERILKSPNFKNFKAQNLELVPKISPKGDKSMFQIMYELFVAPSRPDSVPRANDDLKQERNEDFLVWFGHSSYLIQLNGARFLIDPVLNESASPVQFVNKPFNNTQFFIDELPSVDYLIITHNHYDHLSKASIKALKNSIKGAFVPLGVGKYLKAWGIDEDKITELDWNESARFAPDLSANVELIESKESIESKRVEFGNGFLITALTARHFSGRGLFDQSKSLWASFMLQTAERTIYIGGDSGYGAHFKEIGKRFDIDLALLENGQYNENWAFIHMFPHQTLEAARDLGAKFLMPIHNSKFKISYHAWDEPLRDISALYSKGEYGFKLWTPKIGQVVNLWEENDFSQWWN